MPSHGSGQYGTREAAQKIGISVRRLRYWQHLGIVRPRHERHGGRKFWRYSWECVQRATFIRILVDERQFHLQDAIKRLRELR